MRRLARKLQGSFAKPQGGVRQKDSERDNAPLPAVSPKPREVLTDFKYNRPLSGREIRLLRILPGSETPGLECELFEQDLDSDADFEALSYTWGTSFTSKTIRCNGKVMGVTENLHDALMLFREQGIRGSIWIDAICINQDDLTEKQEQVRMMLSIYERAKLVRVWLGPLIGDTDEAKVVAFLDAVYTAVKQHTSQPRDAENYINLNVLGSDFDALSLEPGFWLFKKPWFSRVWIIQELLAAAVVIFHLGPYEISSDKLLQVAYWMRSPRNRGVVMAGRDAIAVTTLIDTSSILATLKFQHDSGVRLPLSDLVRMTAMFNASEQRDRVFALVGLASDGDPSIIDYEKDQRTIYCDLALNALSRKEDLKAEGTDFLSKVHMRGDDKYDLLKKDPFKLRQTLPSWAPYLSFIDGIENNDVVPLSELFSSKPPHCTKEIDIIGGPDETLKIPAKLLTTFRTLVATAPYDMPLSFLSSYSVVKGLFNQLGDWQAAIARLIKDYDPYWNGEKLDEAWARTLVFDSAWPANSVKERKDLAWKYRRCYLAFCRYIELFADKDYSNAFEAAAFWANSIPDPDKVNDHDGEITADDVVRYVSTFDRLARGRRFCVNPGGAFGWVPAATHIDDLVVLFRGCRTPFVVRPNEGSSAVKTGKTDGSTFKIVGACYIHGLMGGDRVYDNWAMEGVDCSERMLIIT